MVIFVSWFVRVLTHIWGKKLWPHNALYAFSSNIFFQLYICAAIYKKCKVTTMCVVMFFWQPRNGIFGFFCILILVFWVFHYNGVDFEHIIWGISWTICIVVTIGLNYYLLSCILTIWWILHCRRWHCCSGPRQRKHTIYKKNLSKYNINMNKHFDLLIHSCFVAFNKVINTQKWYLFILSFFSSCCIYSFAFCAAGIRNSIRSIFRSESDPCCTQINPKYSNHIVLI